MLRQRISPGAIAYVTSVSEGNLGDHVGDDPVAVARRRDLLSARVGAIAWMSQVHGTDVLVADAPGDCGTADGLIAVDPGISPAVLTADCVPLLLANESGGVRAAIHVGRRGLISGIVPRAVRRLRTLTSEPLYALIGPSICGGCYEVSDELAREAETVRAAAVTRWGTPSIDVPAGVKAQLGEIAVAESGVCTLESNEYFSYRRHADTGRFASIAVADTPK